MIVAGVMSGTSADGIDVAFVRITDQGSGKKRPGKNNARTGSLRLKLLGHAAYPYPTKVRQAVLAAMNAECASVADLARLNNLLGELYAAAILATQKELRIKAQLVGCHGQT